MYSEPISEIPKSKEELLSEMTVLGEEEETTAGMFKDVADSMPIEVQNDVKAWLVRTQSDVDLVAPTVKFPQYEEQIRELEQLHESHLALREQYQRLEEAYKPYQIEDIRALSEKLVTQMDYDSLAQSLWLKLKYKSSALKYALQDTTVVYGIHRMAAAQRLEDFSVEELTSLQGSLEDFKETPSFRFIKKLEFTPSEDELSVSDLVSRLETHFGEVTQFITLAKKFSKFNAVEPHYARATPVSDMLKLLTDQQEHQETPNAGVVSELNPYFLNSLYHVIYSDLARYGLIPGTKNIDVPEFFGSKVSAEVAASIPMKGFEVPDGMEAVITHDEIRTSLLRHVPMVFLRNLSSIQIDKPIMKLDLVNKRITHSTGEHVTYFNGDGTINSHAITIRRPHVLKAGSTELSRNFALQSFNQTLYHESAHCAHADLSIDEMARWSEISEGSLPFTRYGRKSYEVSENSGIKEDFAESFAFYILAPEFVFTLSDERFNFMLNLFESRLPPNMRASYRDTVQSYVSEKLAEYASRGTTKEDLISAWYLGEELDVEDTK